MYQYLFQQAFVIDGTGQKGRIADVAVEDGRIVKIASEIKGDAAEIIPLNGNVLCPGFIDVHSHSDISLLYENNPGSKIFQGITTEVIGNCGFSPFPLIQERAWLKQRRSSLAFIDVEQVPWDWADFGAYKEKMETAGPNVNLLLLVGHGSIRAVVMGYDNKRASAAQLEQMCSILEEHLKAGAAGISTGLGYPPDFYGDEEELTALAKVIAKYGRIFTFHIRGERATLFKAVEEVISIGRNSKAKVHISHLKCAGVHNMGRSGELLNIIDDAVEEGGDLSFDLYPYTAGSSYLGLLFPPAFHEGGMAELVRRLNDPQERNEIIRQMEEGTAGWSTFIGEHQGENLMITSVALHKECIGRRISEIARDWNCSPSEAACRLMVDENGRGEMVMFLTTEEDMNRIASHERCLYGTDGLAMGGTKPLIRQMPHPRYYGSFPVLWERYVNSGLMSAEQLIHKTTEAAAKRFGLAERGAVKEGFWADLAVIGPEGLKAAEDYERPCMFSEGIRYLMVNGVLEIRDGRRCGDTGGRILKSY